MPLSKQFVCQTFPSINPHTQNFDPQWTTKFKQIKTQKIIKQKGLTLLARNLTTPHPYPPMPSIKFTPHGITIQANTTPKPYTCASGVSNK